MPDSVLHNYLSVKKEICGTNKYAMIIVLIVYTLQV